jgi:hypothetical protein
VVGVQELECWVSSHVVPADPPAPPTGLQLRTPPHPPSPITPSPCPITLTACATHWSVTQPASSR